MSCTLEMRKERDKRSLEFQEQQSKKSGTAVKVYINKTRQPKTRLRRDPSVPDIFRSRRNKQSTRCR